MTPAVRARTRRGEAARHLRPRRPDVRRRRVVGGAVDHRFVAALREDRRRSRRHQDRVRAAPGASAEIARQRVLRRAVQPVLDEIDDERGLLLQAAHQRAQRRGVGGAVRAQPGQRLLDPRGERRVLHRRPRGAAVHREEARRRQRLRDLHRQPRLPAAQRSRDVGQRAHLQREPLAAPRPWQRDVDRAARVQLRADRAHPLDRLVEPAPLRLERAPMRRQRGRHRRDIAGRDTRDLRQAQPQRPQPHDLGRPRQLVGAVHAPARRRAPRRHQPARLVEP